MNGLAKSIRAAIAADPTIIGAYVAPAEPAPTVPAGCGQCGELHCTRQDAHRPLSELR